MCYKLTLITLTTIITMLNCWNLNNININGDDYFASSIAVYKTRTFLAIPRSSCFNKLKYPTLIELVWTGDNNNNNNNNNNNDINNLLTNSLNFLKNRIYPREQLWHVCKYLQDVISIDVEINNNNNGRLWILDKGNNLCRPKILIYNLYFNNLLLTHKLYDGISRYDLNSLTLDVVYENVAAYIGDTGDGNLIELTYNNNQLKCRLIKLSTNYYVRVSTKFIAISKNEPILYTTSDNDLGLFSLNLNDLRNTRSSSNNKYTNIKFNITYLGNKLGKSSGLITDLKGNLIYYMTRDYAIMSWNTRRPLTAEYHNLILQSYEKLPYVSRLFNGPNNNNDGGIWALVNRERPEWCTDRNRTINKDDKDYPKLTSRIIKLN